MEKQLYLYVFILTILVCKAQEDNEEFITSDLNFVKWDLDDECTDTASVMRRYLLGDKHALDDKISYEVEHGNLLYMAAMKLKKYEDVPFNLEKNYSILVKCGDALLPSDDYKNLITFANKHVEFGNTDTSCNLTEDCSLSKEDVSNILSTSRNATKLKNAWQNWNSNINGNQLEYRNILNLVNKAANLNELYDAKSYWSMLSDVNDAYSKMEELWTEIEPLYQKLHQFVKIRLNKFYNSSFEDIPVYLLGSKYGEDWINIADVVLPHPQFYYDAKVELESMNIKQSYKFGENFTKSLHLGGLGKHFWSNSNFNYSECKPEVLNFCAKEYSEVFVCSKNTFSSYITAYEINMDIATTRNHIFSLPLQNLRYSAIRESLTSMGSLYAINNIPYHGMVEPNAFFSEKEGVNNKMTAYLLTALNILPKLAYYYAVDMWRLQELENPSDDLAKSWWEYRQKYQGIEYDNNTNLDFLEDEIILYNKPYISKFFGLVLQFQILNNYQILLFEDNSSPINSFKDDSSFRDLIRNNENRGVLDLLSYHYGIDDFSTYPLVEFFGTLEEYLENAPVEQVLFTLKKPKLPPTTTTPNHKKPQRKFDLNDTISYQNDVSSSLETTTPSLKITTEPQEKQPLASKSYTFMVFCIAVIAGICALMFWNRRTRARNIDRRNAV